MRHFSSTWRLSALAMAALVAGAGTAGTTYALWNESPTVEGATITAGTLGVSAENAAQPVWSHVSPDAVNTPETIDPAAFLVRQGDQVRADYAFAIELDGENMRAELTLNWTRLPALPAGVTASVEVFDDEDLVLSAPLPRGADSSLTLGAYDFDGRAGSEEFTLSITLDFADLDDRFGAAADTQVADLGDFTVDLEQVREGEGFNE